MDQREPKPKVKPIKKEDMVKGKLLTESKPAMINI